MHRRPAREDQLCDAVHYGRSRARRHEPVFDGLRELDHGRWLSGVVTGPKLIFGGGPILLLYISSQSLHRGRTYGLTAVGRE